MTNIELCNHRVTKKTQKYGLYNNFDQLFLILVCSSSMSSFSFTNFSLGPLKYNNILLSSEKFTLDLLPKISL